MTGLGARNFRKKLTYMRMRFRKRSVGICGLKKKEKTQDISKSQSNKEVSFHFRFFRPSAGSRRQRLAFGHPSAIADILTLRLSHEVSTSISAGSKTTDSGKEVVPTAFPETHALNFDIALTSGAASVCVPDFSSFAPRLVLSSKFRLAPTGALAGVPFPADESTSCLPSLKVLGVAMEIEITDKLQQFVLSEKEVEGITLSEDGIRLSLQECQISLIRKIFGEKWENYIGLTTTLRNIWALKTKVYIQSTSIGGPKAKGVHLEDQILTDKIHLATRDPSFAKSSKKEL
ncbi:phosphatidylinositolN-acetylglucosaminyltransferase subunit P [Striga asiatica]|uniref:PhosphatidylinositolN-acetylglucosaminyltransferase subunit P n=1 Tax=Striga asiatica TaxID=4170 RepID=A0A5A7PA18_STRAF|nr:phosphatidylinositolN-acetylglucosaminyltransferase subunit P [Striga asiatica]